ncbi:MAG: hypothetical protein K6G70_10275 [Bacteroidaceae bacterium]|nr:hypothetical protein [Bacteroidaceae bacterium]
MAPLAIEGGTVFTVGGFIGDMPSVPTSETAKQFTVLLSGLHIVKDEPVSIYDAKGRLVLTVTIPSPCGRVPPLSPAPPSRRERPIPSRPKTTKNPSPSPTPSRQSNECSLC